MKLVATMAVRNEAFCLGLTARAALMWCDALVCLNHASTDASSDILADVSRETGRVVVISEESPQWDEMRHRMTMLEVARGIGATHIAIVDADELLTGNMIWRMPQIFQGDYDMRGDIMQLPGYNLRGRINRYHANGIWGNRWFSTAFRDDARLSWSGDTFHAREPKGIELKPYRPIAQGQGGVLHLWASSEKRLLAKHRLYQVTERVRWPHKPVADIRRMYGWATVGEHGNASIGTPATWTYKTVPDEWLTPYRDLIDKYYHPEIEPWQNAEADRMIAEYGVDYFKGLDL